MTTAGEVGNKSEPMLGARSTSWLADWLASKNDFASSRHEWYSPPRMKIRLGYFHVSIKNA
jgi:hypothetical protein